jgi:exopolysaccharide biosynthesis polyprenyl glycosylphosphotransferase
MITVHVLRKIRRREWFETVIVIGTGRNADRAKKNLNTLGFHVAGFVKDKEEEDTPFVDEHEIIGDVDALANLIEQRKIDEIVVAVDKGNIGKLVYSLYRYKKPVKIIAEKKDLLLNIKVKTIHGIPFIDVTENNFSEFEKNIKWLIDKIVAASVLLVFSPLYAFIAIRVKINSKGPVFFKQERIGYRGNPFMIYKFRTMYADSATQGPLLTAIGDKRVTSFGRFLRKYRLDEIPQFWNVLKNEMSLVGPRPEQRYYIDRIVEKAPYYYLLHNVRPGITSWGMVNYGYAETIDKMIERLDYDILYYENMSLVLDITIMIYTVKIVFTGKGV